MDILHFWDCLANIVKNTRSANLTPGSERILKDVTYVAWHNK